MSPPTQIRLRGYAADPVMANPVAYGFKGIVAKPYTSTALRETVAWVLA
jgi:hypothetical protein